jgi:serine/threonine protein kinase/Tol biopolymer transport system component
MTLRAGSRLGRYEILSPLGAGGMGEVYRARDPHLGREVALKVLSAAVSSDPERLQRFELEARATAALNHPNILAVHDVGQHDKSPYIVSELLEGETVRRWLAGGVVPVRKAVECAMQVAHGLAAAHERGIVHRDLKPENIFITSGGRVKILDLGLAKLMHREWATDTGDVATVPADTLPGVVLGTVGYMSPEQVRGLPADHRSDIFALGAVLYEMLSGRRAFHSDTTPDTLTAILREDPPALPATERHIPPALVRIVNRCLEKSPDARFKSADDLAFALETVLEASSAERVAAVPGSRNRRRLAWAAVFTLVMLVVVAAVLRMRPAARAISRASEIRVQINTPPTTDPISLAISPDGQKIVFQGLFEGGSRLWLRSLDSFSPRPLVGTDFGSYPFWSPDSRSIGFFADGQLKRLDVESGTIQKLANVPAGRGGTWNRAGTILFAQLTGGIQRISDRGGDPLAVTRLELPQQSSHRFPQFLHDGIHFLYHVVATPEARGAYIGRIDGSLTRRLMATDAAAVYLPPEHLLVVRQGTLFAQRFDPVGLTLSGDPIPVAAQAGTTVSGAESVPAVAASSTGSIVYRIGPGAAERQFVWFDRSGRELERVGTPLSGLNPSISPDERHVAVYRTVGGNTDIWLLDTARGVLSRFTFDAANDVNAIWSPDGGRMVFQSNRKGVSDLYQKALAGGGKEEPLLASSQDKAPMDWSSDGRFLLFRNTDPNMGYDLWALPFGGERTPFPVVQTNFEERDGQFAPDGRWVAYQSNESGRVEVYVQPFPHQGGKWQISSAGGAQVRWRRDGKELFYIALDGRLMAVSTRTAAHSETFDAGAPVPLFRTRLGGAVQAINRQQYIVSADGQRFLMNTLTEESGTSPLMVVLNWNAKP